MGGERRGGDGEWGCASGGSSGGRLGCDGPSPDVPQDDAGAITEEFREKLQMMRSTRSVVSGTAVAPATDPAVLSPRK